MAAEKTIAVLGAGSWGSALAMVLAGNGNRVHLWGNDVAQMQNIASTRTNLPFIKGNFPESIHVFTDLREAVSDTNDILIVVPTVAFLEVVQNLFAIRKDAWRIVWGTKGLVELQGENKLLPTALKELHGDIPVAVLSGPSFAGEVASGLPTCLNLASNNSEFAADLKAMLTNPNFRIDVADDMVSISLGGVIKNIFAILSGISDGLGWGANARCALISWGYAEMSSLLQALGGSAKSLIEVACVGDLILTCTDDQSRNRRFGKLVGAGKTTEQALAEIGAAVEGYANVKPVYELAKQHQLQVPVLEAAYKILSLGQDSRTTLAALFAD